jgi:hypothetical protein
VQLAQLDVALPVAPPTGPELAGFVAALAPVNAVADAVPGFRSGCSTCANTAPPRRVHLPHAVPAPGAAPVRTDDWFCPA